MSKINIRTILTYFLSFIVFLSFGFGGSNAKAAASIPNDTWYLVCEINKQGEVNILSQKVVKMQAPLQTMSEQTLSEQVNIPDRLNTAWEVRLLDKTGKVVYRTLEWLANDIRGDVSSVMPGEEMKGIFFQPSEQAFVVRVPYIPNTRLQLNKGGEENYAIFEMDQVGQTIPEIVLPEDMKISTHTENGPASNRADVLLMGDGFTQGQENIFRTLATQLENGLYQISPLTEYSNYFNTIHLFTPSQESGADHPTYNPSCPGVDNPGCCRDTTMQNDPLNGQFVNTAYDARYCAYHMHRALVVNNQKVLAGAAAYPDWDTIIVIVNDTTYGGTGGQISVVTASPSAMIPASQHEFGHTFGKLADEYSTPYPGFPTCTDKGGGTPCEANVTDVTNRNSIKWGHWIDASTPIPTPPQSQGPDFVGLFQGARYFSTGMYRPGRQCMMQSLAFPFCKVPVEALIVRFYQGGWGKPETGISQIEPDSAIPEENEITLTHPATQTFSVEVLQPVGGPASQIQWYDGLMPIPGATSATFTYETREDQVGTHNIRVVITDKTDLVHPNAAGSHLSSSHNWKVDVEVQQTSTPSPTMTPTVTPTPTQPPVVIHHLYFPAITHK